MDLQKIEELNSRFKDASANEVLAYFLSEYKGKIALASSLGGEDQVLTEMVVAIDPEASVFTLDTGRLFPETYELIHRTNSRYKIKMKVYCPETSKLEEMVNIKGINSFYESIDNRKECCQIRKIQPLLRAFKGLDVWICGLRRDQSVTRQDMQVVEWDANNNLMKINPLINWFEQDVWDYVDANKIPVSPLHKKGYPSIGCEPCTRAIAEGEDVRAGRWWWESPELKECGLHKR